MTLGQALKVLQPGPYLDQVVEAYWRRDRAEAKPCVVDGSHDWTAHCWLCCAGGHDLCSAWWREARERR